MPYSDQSCADWQLAAPLARNRSTDTRRLGSTRDILDDIKDHIAGGDPVIAGITACEDFQNPTKGLIETVYGSSCSGHAVLLVGYDDELKAVRVFNSWGQQWGDGGKACMSYNVLRQRLREAYIDNGPSLNPSGSNFIAQALNASPETASPTPLVNKDVLLHALKVSIDPRVVRQFLDGEGQEKVSEWSIWLNLPHAYRLQISKVSYEFHHETFHHPIRSQKGSSLFLGSWKGFGCVDSATVIATLTDGSIIPVEFNLCELVKTQVPKDLWPPAV
jgi:hypothetical protein